MVRLKKFGAKKPVTVSVGCETRFSGISVGLIVLCGKFVPGGPRNVLAGLSQIKWFGRNPAPAFMVDFPLHLPRDNIFHCLVGPPLVARNPMGCMLPLLSSCLREH